MLIGFPLVFLMIPIVWYVLWRLARRDHLVDTEDKNVIREQLRALGHVKPQEKATLIVFALTAVVWIMSKQVLDIIQPIIGLKLSTAHIEGGISLLAGLVLLALRVERKEVLAPRSLKNLPWGTLVLLGGSFSLAGAVQSSGLSDFFGRQLQAIQSLDAFWQIVLVSVTTVTITAVASNTATIAVMLNVLKGIISPTLLPVALFTSTFASSCDFALPAGTPPNAIVFGSGYVTIPQMAKTGVVLDLTASIVVALWCWFVVPLVL
jgi:sodium-dependent dicarboxylate transporter 2/3/5